METEKEQVVEEKVEVEEAPPAEESDESPPEEEPEKPPEEPEPEKPPEVDPKDAVIGGMRRSLRTAERRADRAEGALAAKVAGPPEKSPLELAAEEQGRSLDDVIIDGKLLQKHEAWKEKQAGKQAQQQATQDYNAGSEAAFLTMTDESLGEGLGLESLAKLGDHLLTDTDHQEIFMAGKKCGTVLYKKLKQRIQEADGAEAQELQKRLKPQKSQSKPKEKQPKDKTEKKEPPEAEEILDASSAQIGATFDL